MATALVCNARKGISAKQIERDLDISYKTAWYLCHRIRESMRGGAPVFSGMVGMDEMFVGGRGLGQSHRPDRPAMEEIGKGRFHSAPRFSRTTGASYRHELHPRATT
jgi:hypothetical protein